MNINKIIKSTILNVDSSTRIIAPKYIYKSDGKFLPNDPLYFTLDEQEIKIHYPHHQLLPGDNIIIQNVVGPSKILYNSFYLFNNFNYLVINYQNHNIPSNYYTKYGLQLYIDIQLYGDVNITNIINNIPLNSFIGIKQLYIYSDISNYIPTNIANYLNGLNTNDLLFIKLDFNYLNLQQTDIINNSPLILGTQQAIINGQSTTLQIGSDQVLYTQQLTSNQVVIAGIPITYTTKSNIEIPLTSDLILSEQYNIILQQAGQTILNQTFSVSFLSIAGINIGYINSNFPINNYNFQSNQTITKVVNDYIYININSIKGAYISINGGGNNIQIMKILDTIQGYPYSNNYSIELKQTFKNVIYVELLSTEFPYIDYSIKNNINNKFYWQNIEDGNQLYSVAIDEGFYNLNKLIFNLQTKMNGVLRNISTSTNPIYNIFDISYDNITNKVIFNSYNNILLPNSLSIVVIIIDNISYYELQIEQVASTINVGDIIYIQNALQVSIISNLNIGTQNDNQQINMITQEYIPASYINNQNFTVYSINPSSNTYSILLGKVSNINKISTLSNSLVNLLPNYNNNINPSYINNIINLSADQLQILNNINELCNTSQITTSIISKLSNNIIYSYGGNDIIIKQNTKFRLLFNRNDTFGDILGFKDIGSTFAITPFNKTISNFDNYVINNNLNSVGDLITSNNLINLSGQNTYFLMYMNNIEFINNINFPTAFAKILLSGNQGDYLFNTFVKQPSDIYSPIFPIPEITSLNISFLYPDGTVPDFRNINHSFTIKIVEEIIQSNDVQRNSNHTNYINEMKSFQELH